MAFSIIRNTKNLLDNTNDMKKNNIKAKKQDELFKCICGYRVMGTISVMFLHIMMRLKDLSGKN
jgi:hypothetical protein